MRRGFGSSGTNWLGRARQRKSTIRAAAGGGLLLAIAAGAIIITPAEDLKAGAGDRTLSIYNIHTKETVTATFKRNGEYDKDGLTRLNHVMRDWRIDQATEMDPELIDLLWELHTELQATEPIHLISGYRSKKTNNMLRRTRGGQARRSQHTLGKAADVHFPGVPVKRLRNAALIRERGGVGYYPRSGIPFVHVDTGRVRHWPRIPAKQLAAIKRSGNPNHGVDPVPVTRVATVSVDSQVTGPRSKPIATIESPAPVFASVAPSQPFDGLLLRAGESVEEPTRRPIQIAEVQTAPVQGWGQSYLAPSRGTPLPPRPRPLLADSGPAGPTIRGVQQNFSDGISRIASTFSATPTTNQPAKSDAPLTATIATGYAPPAADDRRDPLVGLLDNPAGDLPSLIAEAQLLQDQVRTARGTAARPGAPLDLRPATLSEPAIQPVPQAATPAPVMTAALAPTRPELEQQSDSVAQTLVAHVPQAAPVQRGPLLQTDAYLFTSLLRAPAAAHSQTFEPIRVASASVSAFTLSEHGLLGPRPVTFNAPPAKSENGLMAMVNKVVDWIFGD